MNSCLAYYKEGYVQKYLQLYVYARVQKGTHISMFRWVRGPPRSNSSPVEQIQLTPRSRFLVQIKKKNLQFQKTMT